MIRINTGLGLIVVTLIFLFLVTGWVRNLVKFTRLDFSAPYKAEIIRGLSLSPGGMITGWIKIEDN